MVKKEMILAELLGGKGKNLWITAPVVIGNNVWIGDRVIILPGVHIGNGTIIGAGSVVTRDIPPNSVAAGNPAKVLKNRVEPMVN